MLRLPESKHPCGGFTLIALLIVLAILFILYYNQSKPTSSGLTPQQVQIEKSQETLCLANRATTRTNIQLWTMTHPGEAVTLEAMAASGSIVPACPDGGAYSIQPDGSIFCTKHASRFQQIMAPGSHVTTPGGTPQQPGQLPPEAGAAGQMLSAINAGR